MISTQIHKEILEAKTILLQLHASPDGDSFGSTLAFAHYLRSIGKDVVHIQGISELPRAFSNLPGADKILRKGLNEIDPEMIDLFLIADTGSKKQLIGESPFPNFKKIAIIDHHLTNDIETEYKWIDPEYVSACEMVFDFIKEVKGEISEDIATCLYIGMYTDSGGFKYERTDAETLMKASEILRVSLKPLKHLEMIENSNTQGSLDFMKIALNNISKYKNLALASISFSEMENNKIKKEDANSHLVSNLLKSVEGNDVSVIMIEIEKSKVKTAFRTRNADKYNLSIFAKELGGGGHKAAAGAVVDGTIEEVKDKLIKAFDKLYN